MKKYFGELNRTRPRSLEIQQNFLLLQAAAARSVRHALGLPLLSQALQTDLVKQFLWTPPVCPPTDVVQHFVSVQVLMVVSPLYQLGWFSLRPKQNRSEKLGWFLDVKRTQVAKALEHAFVPLCFTSMHTAIASVDLSNPLTREEFDILFWILPGRVSRVKTSTMCGPSKSTVFGKARDLNISMAL